MTELFSASFRAIRSLFAPGMLGVMVLCVLTTILVLSGFVGLASTLFAMLTQNHWLAWAGGIGSGILAWFLFPGIMPIVVNFFTNHIVGLIEKQDYPGTVPTLPPNFWAEFWYDACFSFITILLNILVLPLYLIPPINVILFYLLNGYLLGRGFFVMTARRHLPVAEAEKLRKRHGRAVLTAGIVFTVMATIPIVNLFAPFWGIAVMTHLYHRLAK